MEGQASDESSLPLIADLNVSGGEDSSAIVAAQVRDTEHQLQLAHHEQNEDHKHKERRHSRRSSRRHSHKSPQTLPEAVLDPAWIRSYDQNHNIYYYNTITQESTWLAPCCHCQETADRWCLDCKRSYCDHHFVKIHEKLHLHNHKWQFKEAHEPAQLQPGEEFCIACKSKAAFKMCLDCCDPYCLACFALVHHVGALKAHKAMPTNRYKMGWMTLRNHKERVDTYLHGVTGESMEDKPIELLTEWEKTTLENIRSHKAAAHGYLETLEKLRAELVVVSKERDRAVVETTKAVNEMREKAAAKERAEELAFAKSEKAKSSKSKRTA